MVLGCLEIDDMEASGLSMFNMDRATSRIPVVTYVKLKSRGFGDN